MNIAYNPPTKNDKGIYVFKKPIERSGLPLGVSSLEEYSERQERILKVTQSIVDYLTARELPDGVEGDVKVIFDLWDACKWILDPFGLGKVGEFGFPDFSIQTNYGHSNLYLQPEGTPYRKGIKIRVRGRGIAEETLKKLQENFKSIFISPDYKLEVYSDHTLGELTTILSLSKPR